MNNEITGILLCGGKSSRMGKDKYALLYGNQPMYQAALNTLRKFCATILISSNKHYPEFANYHIIADEVKEIGPMGGLYTCLKASNTALNMVLACDMPLAKGLLMELLLGAKDGYDAVIPMLQYKPDPLYAIYNKSVLPIMQQQILAKEYSILNMLTRLNVCYIHTTVHESELKNVNTPEQLA